MLFPCPPATLMRACMEEAIVASPRISRGCRFVAGAGLRVPDPGGGLEAAVRGGFGGRESASVFGSHRFSRGPALFAGRGPTYREVPGRVGQAASPLSPYLQKANCQLGSAHDQVAGVARSCGWQCREKAPCPTGPTFRCPMQLESERGHMAESFGDSVRWCSLALTEWRTRLACEDGETVAVFPGEHHQSRRSRSLHGRPRDETSTGAGMAQ